MPGTKRPKPEDVDAWPRLVEISWVLCDGSWNIGEGRQLIIKPDGFRIPESAEMIHGVSTSTAMQHGRPLRSVLSRFAHACRRADLVMAHDVAFDSGVVGAEFMRMGLDNTLASTPLWCTMGAASLPKLTRKTRGDGKDPTLTEFHQACFGCGFRGEHGGLADVEALVHCLRYLDKKGMLRIEEVVSRRQSC